MKLYFKINERLKKIFNYFSIFTIVLGTTFGSLNSAYADLTLTVGATISPANNSTVGTTDLILAPGDTTPEIFIINLDSF